MGGQERVAMAIFRWSGWALGDDLAADWTIIPRHWLKMGGSQAQDGRAGGGRVLLTQRGNIWTIFSFTCSRRRRRESCS